MLDLREKSDVHNRGPGESSFGPGAVQVAPSARNPVFPGLGPGGPGGPGEIGRSVHVRAGEKGWSGNGRDHLDHLDQPNRFNRLAETFAWTGLLATWTKAQLGCAVEASGATMASPSFASQAGAASDGARTGRLHRAEVEHELATLPPATTDAGHRLHKLTRAFLDTTHWETAIQHGWPLVELFGACPVAPLVRIDRRGLVSGLALSKMIGGRLVPAPSALPGCRRDSCTATCWRPA